MKRLELEAEKGPRGEYRLDADAVARLKGETERIAALHRRAMTVTDTAQALGITRDTVYKQLKRGELTRPMTKRVRRRGPALATVVSSTPKARPSAVLAGSSTTSCPWPHTAVMAVCQPHVAVAPRNY